MKSSAKTFSGSESMVVAVALVSLVGTTYSAGYCVATRFAAYLRSFWTISWVAQAFRREVHLRRKLTMRYDRIDVRILEIAQNNNRLTSGEIRSTTTNK